MNGEHPFPPERDQLVSWRMRGPLLILLLLIIIGTVGYMQIEGMSLIDGLYMTAITISTVGFGEVDPLTPRGRLFTIGLIVAGAGLLAYSFNAIVAFVVSGDWQQYLLRRRQQRMLAQLNNHTIVCGFGRVGRHVADELAAQRLPFVVLDMAIEKIQRVRERGYLAYLGNAANEGDLRAVGIERARALLATASSDAENVFITLTASSMCPNLLIVARANYDETEAKLLRAGATRVILPYRISGRRMASMLVRPSVADFLDEVMHTSALEFLIDEVYLAEGSMLVGQTMGEAHLRSRFGITVLACRMSDEQGTITPTAATLLCAGSQLIVLGTRDQIQALALLARQGE